MKDLLNYYRDELLLLRQKGGAFAKKYPEIAGYIDLKNSESTDPQTERIIESVAFMSARLHQKIDDNAGDIAFHVLNALYPNIVNPLPPCSVVSFVNHSGIELFTPRHTNLVSPNSCLFRTIYPLHVYPLTISNISLEKNIGIFEETDAWYVKIDVETVSVPIERMNINKLLFHINSGMIEDALIVYEAIFSNPNAQVFLQINDKTVRLKSGSVNRCGFTDDEMICPVSKYSSNVFQLFQEMIHFKQKFMFFEINNIDKVVADNKDVFALSIIVQIKFVSDRLLQLIKRDVFMLNCVPIANLFHFTSDPFKFDGMKNRYLLMADQLKDSKIEIHSVSEIRMIDGETSDDCLVQPYFSLSVDSDTNNKHSLFWVHSRESSEIRGLSGNDIYISFIDIKMNPYRSYDNDVAYAKLLCTNRFESREIPVFARLNVESLETGGVFGQLLYKTTDSIDFLDSAGNLWELVSQLSSTHISASHDDSLLVSLKTLIKLFSGGNEVKYAELTSGISNLNATSIVKRFGKEAWRGFVRGLDFKVLCKDDHKNHMVFFLCSFINQYLSSCISINSFVQLNLISGKNSKLIASWNPTSGRRDLI